MWRTLIAGFVALALIGSLGCSRRLTDFTVISTKNVNVPGEQGTRVTGEHKVLFCAAAFGAQPNLKEAIDDAIEKGGGNALIDGVVYSKSGIMSGFEVEGTIIDTRK